jgi:subtilisin family serine protease
MDPDLVLPGVEIYTCVPAGREEFAGASYVYMTGSSASAAHLTALAALVMQACGGSSAFAIAEALKQTASGAGAFDVRSGWGIPNAIRAIQLLQSWS